MWFHVWKIEIKFFLHMYIFLYMLEKWNRQIWRILGFVIYISYTYRIHIMGSLSQGCFKRISKWLKYPSTPSNESPIIIRREMRPWKGRFEVVLYVGNKLFSSFGQKKELKKNSIFGKINYFWKKYFLLLEKNYL